jgi:F-type H+-transporting ATPase subunit gamma
MKMVAAAKLRRAQEAALASRPYARKMGELLSDVASRADVSTHPLFNRNASDLTLVVVVTSDRGLCGGFNTNLCKKASEVVRQEGRQAKLYLIGRKGREYFRRRNFPTLRDKVGFTLGYGEAKLLSEELVQLFLKGEVGEVVIAYNEFKSALAPRLVVETLLPIPRPEAGADPGGAATPYLYEPSPQEILAALVHRHVDTQIWRILLESNAAESAARMTAMEGATKNAGEMIESLTLTMNKIRQAGITNEIIEVVSGASALND